jgi:hypothetical protein
MKKLWLLLAIAVPLQPVCSQEVQHALTVEQCRADQDVWLSKLTNRPDVANVSFKELRGWFNEMNDCESVDPDRQIQYYNTKSETHTEQLMRLEHFILRHNLWDQFITEDEQGNR